MFPYSNNPKRNRASLLLAATGAQYTTQVSLQHDTQYRNDHHELFRKEHAIRYSVFKTFLGWKMSFLFYES
jgi:hypothetical protein